MLIAFEGIDGCGKTTQAMLLHDRLVAQGFAAHFAHYPNYDGEVGKHLVAPFLRGEFGSVDTVNPWLVGLIFSVDRITSASEITDSMANGTTVITDRYLLSNIAFQGAKIADVEERDRLQRWILDLEVSQGVPVPDATFLLDMPARHAHRRSGSDREQRDYLAGATDIHEADHELQRRVAAEYRRLASSPAMAIKTINCLDEFGKRKTPDVVGAEV